MVRPIETLTLADVLPGQTVNILDVDGDDAIAVRLMEMGITEGERVRMVGSAPMGDPVEIALRGYKLSLRRIEAARIRVELASTSNS
jgi:ferrous iron transport protein A